MYVNVEYVSNNKRSIVDVRLGSKCASVICIWYSDFINIIPNNGFTVTIIATQKPNFQTNVY